MSEPQIASGRGRLHKAEIPDGWLSMFQMPIGDQRNIVVEVRGANGEAAMAYWTGQIWAHAPIGAEVRALAFYPVMHRQPVDMPVAGCSCIGEIEAALDEHRLDTSIRWDRDRNSLDAQTFTGLIRRDNQQPERRSKKPKLFGHNFCPFCSAPYPPGRDHPAAIASRQSAATYLTANADLLGIDRASAATIASAILALQP